METRMHGFGEASPELVERQLRMLIPEKQRVSMNAEAGQVIVVAEPETQEKVAAMLQALSRPPTRLQFWVRHNRSDREMVIPDAGMFALPVSDHPLPAVVDRARGMLPPGRERMPVAGSVLQVHGKLLREEPAVVRLRVVPHVLFGSSPPYEVIRFEPLASDLLVNTEDYVDLTKELASHAFYRSFFQEQPHPEHPPRPVALLLSFRGVPSTVATEEADGVLP